MKHRTKQVVAWRLQAAYLHRLYPSTCVCSLLLHRQIKIVMHSVGAGKRHRQTQIHMKILFISNESTNFHPNYKLPCRWTFFHFVSLCFVQFRKVEIKNNISEQNIWINFWSNWIFTPSDFCSNALSFFSNYICLKVEWVYKDGYGYSAVCAPFFMFTCRTQSIFNVIQ